MLVRKPASPGPNEKMKLAMTSPPKRITFSHDRAVGPASSRDVGKAPASAQNAPPGWPVPVGRRRLTFPRKSVTGMRRKTLGWRSRSPRSLGVVRSPPIVETANLSSSPSSGVPFTGFRRQGDAEQALTAPTAWSHVGDHRAGGKASPVRRRQRASPGLGMGYLGPLGARSGREPPALRKDCTGEGPGEHSPSTSGRPCAVLKYTDKQGPSLARRAARFAAWELAPQPASLPIARAESEEGVHRGMPGVAPDGVVGTWRSPPAQLRRVQLHRKQPHFPRYPR